MAKSWTLKEAVKAIQTNDVEALNDFGRRMPVLTGIITKAVVGDKEGLNQMFDLLPDHCTLNRMNANLTESVKGESCEECDETPVADEPKEKAKPKSRKGKKEEVAEEATDLESMTTKQLYQMCIDKGLKVSKYGKNKAYYIEQLQGTNDVTEEVEDKEEEAAEEKSYAGISPANLYKECRKRGIKTKPRLNAGDYIALLKEDDAKSIDDNDEDWDDEPKEEKVPKASKAKGIKKSKPAPKVEEKDDEDDDDDESWDI